MLDSLTNVIVSFEVVVVRGGIVVGPGGISLHTFTVEAKIDSECWQVWSDEWILV